MFRADAKEILLAETRDPKEARASKEITRLEKERDEKAEAAEDAKAAKAADADEKEAAAKIAAAEKEKERVEGFSALLGGGSGASTSAAAGRPALRKSALKAEGG